MWWTHLDAVDISSYSLARFQSSSPSITRYSRHPSDLPLEMMSPPDASDILFPIEIEYLQYLVLSVLGYQPALLTEYVSI